MTKMNLIYSAEMMTNYLQAELISPQQKFEALQTSDGHALLFSIATDGVFYLTREESGKSAAGWSKTDLSSAQIKKDFAGQAGVTCRTFDSGQSVQDGTLGLAMAVETSAGDHLYLCLGNSNKDISWADSPNWVSYEYDDPANKVSKLEIVNVFFCETYDKTQYIIVDIVRDPSSAVKEVSRYYIDPSKASGHYWNEHFLPVDIEAEVGTYDSCLGRASNGYVDGLYTAGRAGASGQLIFRPVINVFGDAPPTVVTLSLPGGAIASAIASTRNPDLSTDLFAVSSSTLYYFASTNQAAKATGATLITNDVISGTSKLSAMAHNGVITLWGRNASDQVYYTSCPQAQVSDPTAWSVPVPILSGIEEMSPYVNGVDGGNTIFAGGGGKLQRITQASTSTAKMWQTSQITLPVPPTSKSISFNSYTTTIQVTDEQNLPLNNAALSLSANSRCAVYINGLYYVLDRTPIHIKTNALGSITIVESTGTLNGTTFKVSTGTGAFVTINPMDEPFKKLAALGDSNGNSDKLSQATFKEGDGTTQKPFVEKNLVSGAKASDLKAVAIGLSNIGQSYNSVNSSAPRALAAFAAAPSIAAPMDIGDNILIAAGDLFRWLESDVEAVLEVIEDAAEEVWYFVATIAGKVYRAVLDTVEAVVGAVVWVFNAIKTTIEDIIKFVEFLFEWGDITRTKEVLSNTISLFLKDQVDSIQSLKGELDQQIDNVEGTVAKWAGIEWKQIGDPASKPASGSANNPMKGQTSASQHLSHHYQNNASQISVTNAPSPSLVQSLIDDLLAALEQEAEVFDQVIGDLKTLTGEFASLSVEKVMQKLAGILVEGVLGSAKVLMDALLDILTDIGKAALEILSAKIHIPVISDILNAIGIPDISFLDLFCWIGGVAYTVVYKIATGNAPFPDNTDTKLLTSATSLSQLKQSFDAPAVGGSSLRAMAVPSMMAATEESLATTDGPIKLSPAAQQAVYTIGHALGGIVTLISAGIDAIEAKKENPKNDYGKPSAIAAVISGGLVGAADYLVPKAPIQNTAVSVVNAVTSVSRIVSKVIFSGPLQEQFSPKGKLSKLKFLQVADGRAVGSVVDAVLVIPALICTGWHFYELAETDGSTERTDAILEEVSNLAFYIARVSYTTAVNDPEPATKEIAIADMVVADIAYAGLQMAECEVVE